MARKWDGSIIADVANMKHPFQSCKIVLLSMYKCIVFGNKYSNTLHYKKLKEYFLSENKELKAQSKSFSHLLLSFCFNYFSIWFYQSGSILLFIFDTPDHAKRQQ